jgi:hypothetical protein
MLKATDWRETNMAYRWVIQKDFVNTNAVGIQGGGFDIGNYEFPATSERFRMLDGDGEPYYEGLLYFDQKEEDRNPEVWFAPIDDFGEPNAGCTSIEYWNNKYRKWELI